MGMGALNHWGPLRPAGAPQTHSKSRGELCLWQPKRHNYTIAFGRLISECPIRLISGCSASVKLSEVSVRASGRGRGPEPRCSVFEIESSDRTTLGAGKGGRVRIRAALAARSSELCYVMVPLLLPPVNCVEDSWGWWLHATLSTSGCRNPRLFEDGFIGALADSARGARGPPSRPF
jgi:hypothetical protein